MAGTLSSKSNNTHLLSVEGLYKDYSHSSLFFFLRKHQSDKKNYSLKDISFQLSRGEAIGIIGRNGSGKSTLLKLLCRQLEPTRGKITGTNNIRALIELGTGLDAHQSGEENVKFFLRMQGLSGNNIVDKSNEIHAFSELGEKYFSPVITYSSGMFIRLAYSMHSLMPAEVLIVDEALSVGDAKFQHKSFTHIHKLKMAGTSIIFVSHALEQVRQLCNRVIVLEDGELVFDGDVNLGCDKYLNMLFRDNSNNFSENESIDTNSPSDGIGKELYPISNHPLLYSLNSRYGSEIGMIEKIGVMVDGFPVFGLISDKFKELIIILYGSLRKYKNILFGLSVKSIEGTILYGTNSYIDNFPFHFTENENSYHVSLKLSIPLKAGDYFIDIGVASIDGSTGGNPLDVIPSCITLSVKSDRQKINDGFLNITVDYKKH